MLTADSMALLRKIEYEAMDRTAAPFLSGDLTKAETGNLTDLKVKGLVESFEDHDGYRTILWIEPTEAGWALLEDSKEI